MSESAIQNANGLLGIGQSSASTGTANTAGTAKSSSNTSGESQKLTSQEGVSQQEFLTLLVNQLQNQDPLNPMQSEEFAVQLAQFTQVEQLTSINKKMDSLSSDTASTPVGSMASYLGHQVVVDSDQLSVEDSSMPNVLLDLPDGAQSARVDFMSASGEVVHSHELSDLSAGRQTVSLSSGTLPDGHYAIRAVAVGPTGAFEELQTKVTETVEGFVLEPSPALIVRGGELPMEEVKELYE